MYSVTLNVWSISFKQFQDLIKRNIRRFTFFHMFLPQFGNRNMFTDSHIFKRPLNGLKTSIKSIVKCNKYLFLDLFSLKLDENLNRCFCLLKQAFTSLYLCVADGIDSNMILKKQCCHQTKLQLTLSGQICLTLVNIQQKICFLFKWDGFVTLYGLYVHAISLLLSVL